MQLTELTIRLLFLLFPGLLSLLIVEVLTGNRQSDVFRFIVNSFVLSVICYLIYGLFAGQLFFLEGVQSGKPYIYYREILFATMIAIPVSLFTSFLIGYNLLGIFSSKLKITNKTGYRNVWSLVLNRYNQWIVVRDIGNNLVYEGYLTAFSDRENSGELFMIDVCVYKNDSGKKLYHVDAIYISKKPDEFIVEFPEMLANK